MTQERESRKRGRPEGVRPRILAKLNDLDPPESGTPRPYRTPLCRPDIPAPSAPRICSAWTYAFAQELYIQSANGLRSFLPASNYPAGSRWGSFAGGRGFDIKETPKRRQCLIHDKLLRTPAGIGTPRAVSDALLPPRHPRPARAANMSGMGLRFRTSGILSNSA